MNDDQGPCWCIAAMRPHGTLLPFIAAILLPAIAHSDWSADPRVNLAICTAPGDQASPVIVSDGSGGAIIAWQDHRGDHWNIFAQHVLSVGSVDPAWRVDGVAICESAQDQTSPDMVADGAGGAIVSWEGRAADDAGAAKRVFAQHVLPNARSDPRWPPKGRAVCMADSQQSRPVMISDGSGGAIVTWLDSRGPASYAFYAQHIPASGEADSAWPLDGRALCSVLAPKSTTLWNNSLERAMVGDGAGGVLMTWEDQRDRVQRIRAQHVRGDGALDSAWTPNGIVVCASTSNQQEPALVPDGRGGAIILWDEKRGTSWNLYAQHITAAGSPDSTWPRGGRAACAAGGNQTGAVAVADGSGGALIAWHDNRREYGHDEVYCQHLARSGSIDPTWPGDGLRVSRKQDVGVIRMVGDDAGGAIIPWYNALIHIGLGLHGRSMYEAGDVYAQHVLATGAVDPAWPERGCALSTADRDQRRPRAIPDGAGGAITTWQDMRHDLLEGDIFAQRVQSNGRLGGAMVVPH